MIPLSEWLPPAVVGTSFTALGAIKVYGWRKGVIGGGGKPAMCRLKGRCPSWSKPMNLAIITLFWVIGLVNLALLWRALQQAH